MLLIPRPVPPPADWHLAAMQGQGEYFLLQQQTFQDEAMCEATAYKQNQQLEMWRYICLGVPR